VRSGARWAVEHGARDSEVRETRGLELGTAAARIPCMTTIGQLISELYTKYERRYRDDELAAMATQVRLEELLGPKTKRQNRK
jgi:hypothetical protein